MVWGYPGSDTHDDPTVYINFKAIALLLVLAGAAAGGVHALHVRQVAAHTPLVLEEAKKRQAAGEKASALAFYQTYLGYRPNDTQALADHALLKAETTKGPAGALDAFYSLQRALNVAPERLELRKELVRFGVRLSRVRECKKELKELVDEFPQDPEVLLLAARGALQLQEPDEARQRYEELLRLGPADVSVELEYVFLLSNELNDKPAADAAMEKALQRDDIPAELHASAATYYFQRGQMDKAERHVALALNEPETASTTLLQLQTAIARMRRRPLELEAGLSKIIDRGGSDVATQMELVELEFALGRRMSARQRLAQIETNEAATPEQLWHVYLLLQDYQFPDDLTPLREKITQRDKGGRYTRSLIVRDKIRQSDWPMALEISNELIKDSKASNFFLSTINRWRADCYEQLHDSERQKESLRKAVTVNERDVVSRARLARLLADAGRYREALGEYSALAKVSPVYAREFVVLIQSALSGGDRAPLSRAEADALFDDWRILAPDDALPDLCQLELTQLLHDDKESDRLLTKGLQSFPLEVGFHLAQIDRLRRAGDWPAAFAALDEAEAACGAQGALLGRRIAATVESNSPDLPARIKTCVDQFRALDRDSQAVLWPLLLLGLQKAKIDLASVDDLMREYGEENPQDIRAQLMFVQRALADGNLEKAKSLLDQLRQTLGEQSPIVQLASVLYDVKSASLGDREALTRAQEGLAELRAQQESPTPLLLVLEADIDLMQQRPQDALRKLQQALRTGETRRSVFVRTLALMTAGGQLEQVVPFVESLAQSQPADNPDPADSDEPTSDVPSSDFLPPARDLASLRQALDPEVGKSWPVALAAYRLDLALNRDAKARATIEQARREAPSEPIVWANWLGYLERHQPDQLAGEIESAKKELKIVDQGRVLAGLLLRQGHADEAIQLLDQARQEAPADPELLRAWSRLARQRPTEELETTLKQAMDQTDPQFKPSREAARRELAWLWSASKDYGKYRQGVSLAKDIARDADTADLEAQLLQAESLAAHPGYWQEAVVALRPLKAVAQPSVRAEAFSAEARLHDRRKRWDEEQAALLGAHELAADNEQILIRLLLNAVRRNDAEAAEKWHAALYAATEDPKVRLNADVLKGKFSQDRSELASRAMAARRAGQATSELAREWLGLLEADNDLEELLKAEVDPARPETLSRYLLFLAAHQKADEALPVLSQLWKGGNRDAVLMIAAGMAATPRVTPESLQPIRAAVLRLAASDKATFKERLIAAALADHAGQYQDALALYDSALEKSTDNVMGLNNSAFLQALATDQPSEQSLARIDKALELNGPLHQLLDTKGVILFRLGKFSEAAAVLDEAWNQRAETNYLTHLAWARAELGETDAAAKLFQQVDAADKPPPLHSLERPIDAAQRKKAGLEPNDVSP